jgi:hypothetical protein
MRKIFYDEKTLEIKGMSDGEDSMQFPYIETTENYHSLTNLAIEIKNKKLKLKIIKEPFKKNYSQSIIKPRK